MNMINYLSGHLVPFERIEWDADSKQAHESDSQHLRGRHVARTELLRTPNGFVIAILPCSFELDLEALETLLGTRPILPATDQERASLFPGWSDGFVPPVGSVFGVRTVMDIHLAGCAAILFRCSKEGECVRIDLADFLNLEHPIAGRFAAAPQLELAAS